MGDLHTGSPQISWAWQTGFKGNSGAPGQELMRPREGEVLLVFDDGTIALAKEMQENYLFLRN